MPINPSESQSNASRQNGAQSHGATSEAGKAACRRNAVKHGLTGRTLLIAPEDSAAYDRCVAMAFHQFKPVTDYEKSVIQEVADTKWKLQGIPVYEAGLCALGRMANENRFGPEVVHPDERHTFVESETHHTYSKSLTNLAIQQGRAERYLQCKIKEFEKLRAERELLKLANANIAMWSVLGDPKDTRPCHHTVGSVFSMEFLGERSQFIKGAGMENVLVFDRAWGDPRAKKAA